MRGININLFLRANSNRFKIVTMYRIEKCNILSEKYVYCLLIMFMKKKNVLSNNVTQIILLQLKDLYF